MDGRALSGGDGEALPRAARITNSDEIRALFRRGKRRKTRHLDVYVSPSPVSRSRIGLVVAKPKKKSTPAGTRIRGAAVERNRLKRRLREIARTAVLPALNESDCAVDVLVRTRPEAYSATYVALREELVELQEWLCSSAR